MSKTKGGREQQRVGEGGQGIRRGDNGKMGQSKQGREEDNEGEITRQEGKEMRQGKEEGGEREVK